MRNFPKSFIVFMDKEGEPIDSITSQATDDTIFSLVEKYNEEFPADAPFSAWEWTQRTGLIKFKGKRKENRLPAPHVVYQKNRSMS